MLRALALLLVAAVLAGCASNPFPRTLVGQYNARNGEFIVIKSDGRVLWSPPAKTQDRLQHLGIAAPEKGNALQVPMAVHSASPYLDAKLAFSPDFSRLTVDWGMNLTTATSLATEYVRSDSK